MRLIFFIAIFTASCICCAQPSKVKIQKISELEYTLLVDDKPFFIKGGGGISDWESVVQCGGNSVRTWGLENARELLDKAQRLGLKVMMGMWMQHERHGFDYDDKAKVKNQLEYFKSQVIALKDHPALLMWGVGNEVDLFYTNTQVWYAVEDIAKMIHEVDPNHPTCTVTAGLDSAEVRLIKERAPSIDIYGINTYGDISSVREHLIEYGWSGPYMITEWGPNGHWEVTKTKWRAPIEQTSSEKAISYGMRYQKEILSAPKNCLGSYAFLWGHKQETTSTWYGLFSKEHEKTEAVDTLKTFWTNQALFNRSPSVSVLRCNGKNADQSVMLEAGTIANFSIDVSDRDKDALKYTWKLVPESTDIKAGGDVESEPEPIEGAFARKNLNSASLRVPREEGAYRVFYEVRDGHSSLGYANFPFYVLPMDNQQVPAREHFIKQSLND